MMLVTRVTRITAYLVFSLSFLVYLSVAHAATVEWIAAGDGDWNNPANWSSGALPGAADDVVVHRETPVTITHAGNDTQIKSLDLTGSLVLTGGSLTLQAGTSQITANLTLSNGATLTATGSQAVLIVTGTTRIDGGNLYALDGARISLPGTTQYWGSGVFRAHGPGSRLELANLSGIGMPLPDDPLTKITDAVSQEIGVYHRPPELPSDGPAKGILDSTSREISVYHRPPEPPSDGPAKGILDTTSREISVENPVTPP